MHTKGSNSRLYLIGNWGNCPYAVDDMMYMTKFPYRDSFLALEMERYTANSIKRQYFLADQAHSHVIGNLLLMNIILSDFGISR
jgi:hypothetical protein